MDRNAPEEKSDIAKQDIAEHQETSKRTTAHNEAGITLVPAPSDDPRDPLVRTCRPLHTPALSCRAGTNNVLQNWSRGRKLLTLFIVSFAGFTGTLQAVGNVSSIFQQGALYQKTPVEITYSVSSQ